MARPEATIDIVELEKLCSMQCTDEEVAAFFGVSTRTIERRRKVERFREIMDNAKAKGRISVRRSLFRQAANGNIAAAIFLAKNLLSLRLASLSRFLATLAATPPLLGARLAAEANGVMLFSVSIVKITISSSLLSRVSRAHDIHHSGAGHKQTNSDPFRTRR
jgi:hypothetical protein